MWCSGSISRRCIGTAVLVIELGSACRLIACAGEGDIRDAYATFWSDAVFVDPCVCIVVRLFEMTIPSVHSFPFRAIPKSCTVISCF